MIIRIDFDDGRQIALTADQIVQGLIRYLEELPQVVAGEERCPHCQFGKVAGGGYCRVCQLGRDLARQELRDLTRIQPVGGMDGGDTL